MTLINARKSYFTYYLLSYVKFVIKVVKLYYWTNRSNSASFILKIFLFVMQISFIFYQLIFREKYLYSRREVYMLPRLLEERRVDLFAFNEVYRIVCLAYCIYFFLSNGSERYRFSVCFSERTHPRASLILQNGIADGAPEVDRPKRAVPDVPSSLFLLHPG